MQKALLYEIQELCGLRRTGFKEIPEQLSLNEIELLPIALDDLGQVAKLPFHHRDPFDRLIIAQAMTKAIPIVGNDPAFSHYPVELIW